MTVTYRNILLDIPSGVQLTASLDIVKVPKVESREVFTLILKFPWQGKPQILLCRGFMLPLIDMSEKSLTDPKTIAEEKLAGMKNAAPAGPNRRREYLRRLPVVWPVPDLAAAKDPKLMEFCVNQLASGVGPDELRAMLGLGPVSMDERWRVIHRALVQIQVPLNPEQAIISSYAEQEDMIERLNEFVREMDAMIDKHPDSEEEAKQYTQFCKMKLDALAKMLDAKTAKFNQYLGLQKLKHIAKSSGGVRIIINNNIPRPKKELKDVKG